MTFVNCVFEIRFLDAVSTVTVIVIQRFLVNIRVVIVVIFTGGLILQFKKSVTKQHLNTRECKKNIIFYRLLTLKNKTRRYPSTPDSSNESGYHHHQDDPTKGNAGQDAGQELIVTPNQRGHVHFRNPNVQVVVQSISIGRHLLSGDTIWILLDTIV